MFNNVKEVQAADINQLLTIVRENTYGGVDAILSPTLLTEYREAAKVISNLEVLAENIAYEVRGRVQDILDDEDEEDTIDEFMNGVASDIDQVYNGEWESRPDAFWTPSTC